MVATQNDSFPLPDYEDRLWSELAELHAEVADEHGSSRPPLRDHPPRRGRYLMAVAGLAAAASIAAVALVVQDDDKQARTGQEGPATEQTPPAEEDPPADPRITAPAAVAIKELRLADGTGQTEWRDEATGNIRTVFYDTAGNPTDERFIVGTEDGVGEREIGIDHAAHQYATLAEYNGRAQSIRHDEWLLERIDSGTLVASGTEVVDSVELLVYGWHPQSIMDCEGVAEEDDAALCRAALDEAEASHATTWVDPATMRPVREHSAGGTPKEVTVTYTYLDRTPENLALVEFRIPEGYTEVDAGSLHPVL